MASSSGLGGGDAHNEASSLLWRLIANLGVETLPQDEVCTRRHPTVSALMESFRVDSRGVNADVVKTGGDVLLDLQWSPQALDLLTLSRLTKGKQKLHRRRICQYIRELNLRKRKLYEVGPGFAEFVGLQEMDIGNNFLQSLQYLPPQLQIIKAYNNQLTSIEVAVQHRSIIKHVAVGFNQLPSTNFLEPAKDWTSLLSVDISFNLIVDLAYCMRTFDKIPSLRLLWLQGNPFCLREHWREHVICNMPHLDALDGDPVTEDMRAQALETLERYGIRPEDTPHRETRMFVKVSSLVDIVPEPPSREELEELFDVDTPPEEKRVWRPAEYILQYTVMGKVFQSEPFHNPAEVDAHQRFVDDLFGGVGGRKKPAAGAGKKGPASGGAGGKKGSSPSPDEDPETVRRRQVDELLQEISQPFFMTQAIMLDESEFSWRIPHIYPCSKDFFFFVRREGLRFSLVERRGVPGLSLEEVLARKEAASPDPKRKVSAGSASGSGAVDTKKSTDGKETDSEEENSEEEEVDCGPEICERELYGGTLSLIPVLEQKKCRQVQQTLPLDATKNADFSIDPKEVYFPPASPPSRSRGGRKSTTGSAPRPSSAAAGSASAAPAESAPRGKPLLQVKVAFDSPKFPDPEEEELRRRQSEAEAAAAAASKGGKKGASRKK